MNDVNINSKQYPYDMTSWCEEKLNSVVNDLANIIDILKINEKNIPKDVVEEIRNYIHEAIIDSTKVYGFVCGSKLEGGEGNLIFDEGKQGLEKILVKFNRLSYTNAELKFYELKEFIDKVENAINGERSNRTLIYDALSVYKTQDENISKIINSMSDLLEDVTFARLDWGNFVNSAIGFINELKNELNKISTL